MSKKQSDTIANLLGRSDLAPPPRAPEPEPKVPEAPAKRRYLEPEPEEEWDDPEELEQFEFDPNAALVRPRRRKEPEYQTLRIYLSTWKIIRQVFHANRRIDPALTFTEFSTLVVQYGLRALKEERERNG